MAFPGGEVLESPTFAAATWPRACPTPPFYPELPMKVLESRCRIRWRLFVQAVKSARSKSPPELLRNYCRAAVLISDTRRVRCCAIWTSLLTQEPACRELSPNEPRPVVARRGGKALEMMDSAQHGSCSQKRSDRIPGRRPGVNGCPPIWVADSLMSVAARKLA